MTDPSLSAPGLVERIAGALRPMGFDLVQGFDGARYNQITGEMDKLRPLDLFGRDHALGVIVGNSRAIWSHFIEALEADPDLRAARHPLDMWTERILNKCADGLPFANKVHFAHERGQGLVSMLHLCEASGLAPVGPAHLGVHPVHGTWFGLRGVLVIDTAPAQPSGASTPDPCEACDAPCMEALKSAMENPGPVAASWQAWVGVRDACPVGASSRYTGAQMRYHYTRDKANLVK